MRIPRIFTLLVLLALLAGSQGRAQTYPVAPPSNLPWNTYVPSRIPDAFSSIIGNGGTLVPGSNNSSLDIVYPLTLPFNFLFLNTTYAAGYSLRVGSDGYLSFNGSSFTGGTGAYYGNTFAAAFSGNGLPYYNKLILAHATALQMGGVTDAGIYSLVSGNAPNRVFTVEWRARLLFYGDQVGNFQIRLHESTGNIEWFFGPGTMTQVITPGFVFGAWSGIKNGGDPDSYVYSGPTPSNATIRPDDASRQMLFTDPDRLPNIVAVTGLWLYSYGAPFYNSLYFPIDNGLIHPEYIQDNFPSIGGARIGYKASPVLNDVSADSIWLTPTVTANAYAIGATPSVNARIRNTGASPRQNVTVQADLYRNGALQASRTTTVFGSAAPQFTTATASFTAFGPLSGTGIYEVRVYPMYSGDQDAANDTVRATFYISRTNDLMPYAILEPTSNTAPLFTKYPLGVDVPIEARYLNIGTSPQFDARVGYRIYDMGGRMVGEDFATIAGRWDPISFKDIVFSAWRPPSVGRYFIRTFTALSGDEQTDNDIFPVGGAGKPFDVLYEIETSSSTDPNATLPLPNIAIPDGRPTPVSVRFINSGVSDATNVPARLVIRGSRGIVYDRSVIVSDITSDGGATNQRFPDFIPTGSGRYCATATISYPNDPVRANDEITWCFDVAPRLAGTIRVGFGERYRTIQEARDSMFYYGVSAPVTFELVDDAYTVATGEATIPALDFRGRVVGLSAANPVLWKPVAGKSDVTITLRSASGYGMWFGQMDTSNASGYITWDGGTGKVFRFIYENSSTATATSAYNRAIPFYFGQGASNYTIRNVKIQPITGTTSVYRPNALSLPVPGFTQANQQFAFTPDASTTTSSVAVSAGIMLRNSSPIDVVAGRNVRNADTTRDQNNRFENNEIRGFGYGIASVGIGPLFNVGTGRYVEYANQNNVYANNLIENVGRAGIALVYEKGSEISGNIVRRVSNTTTTPHAAGIWATAGGNASNNRGYASDLRIDRNTLSDISAAAGTGAGIWIETSENVLNTPSNVIYRFPTGGATNMRVWNNIAHSYSGAAMTLGVGLTVEPATRIDMLCSGNRIENNTLYNAAAGSGREYGIRVERAGVSVMNNIVALTSPTTAPVALWYGMPATGRTIESDYNLFHLPGGSVGSIARLSPQGYPLPSPPVARTLNQWRATSGMERNSVEGNILPEFVSTAPGSVDLHIRPQTVGSLAGNRGVTISDLATDIDKEKRGGSAGRTRYDIGADEFTGVMRNNDLMAEDIIAPSGYRASAGEFSDAEYIMSDSLVTLTGRVRNVGGMPIVGNVVTMTVEFQNPVSRNWAQVRRTTQTAGADVASAGEIGFGAFMPQTLRELGLNDPFFGASPNVSPIYRITVTTGTDDNAGNNGYSKQVRFYLQRSKREAIVSVEKYRAAGVDAVTLSNRINSDTLLAALAAINWGRADGAGLEDFDLFERDKWPVEMLDLRPWQIVIWEQGSEPEGIRPEERAAIREMLSAGNTFTHRNLVIAGQNVARIHDVALNGTNGTIADQEFVRTTLRARYLRGTAPADYSNRRIRGVTINPGKYETIQPTGVAGDQSPLPAVMAATAGEGIATLSHAYADQTTQGDSGAGISAASPTFNTVYYGFDWRHAGRFSFEPARSGAQRLLLAALDFIDQYSGVLPLTLVDFTAYQSGERAVNVEWETARETEISGLEVERAEVLTSEAGESIGSFHQIDRVEPKGTATTGASYRTNDRDLTAGGVYLYRLTSVNLEGVRTVEASRRVALTSAGSSGYSLTVLPNPISGSGSIAWSAPRGERLTIELHDLDGQLVRTLASDLQSNGDGTLTVDAGMLPSGSYTVRLRSGSGGMTFAKLTIVK